MSDQVVPASEGRNMLMFLIPSFAGILFLALIGFQTVGLHFIQPP